MKNYNPLVLFLTVILFSISCKKDEPVTKSQVYLPMQVQNYWEIQDYIKYTITGTKVLGNKTYFVFVQGNDTSYYRNENNKIYVRRSVGNESVKFDFTEGADKIWEFQDGGTTWSVSRSNKADTIIINNTKVPHCYQFIFDIPMSVDAAHSVWLAPDIGFIKMTCGYCPYPYLNLRKANINNKEITFP